MVMAKIPKIEEDVAHPGVFPIDQAHFAYFAGHLLIQKIEVEQIIMARHRSVGILQQYLLRFLNLLHDPIKIERELAVVSPRNVGEHFNPAENVEFSRKFGCIFVKYSQLACQPPDIFWPGDLRGRNLFTIDKTRHQITFRLYEVYYLGRNTQSASCKVSSIFYITADAQ